MWYLRVLHYPYFLAPLGALGGFLLVGDMEDCVSPLGTMGFLRIQKSSNISDGWFVILFAV